MIYAPKIRQLGERHLSADAPIAVFDSGAGGIGVLREVQKVLPAERLFYFGDTANAPYGEKSDAKIRRLALLHGERLLKNAKALLIACNTATALAAAPLRARHPDRLIVGMEPAIFPALAVTAHPRVLVLVTAATERSEKFRALLRRAEKKADVTAVAAPDIVPLVEAGLSDSPEMERSLRALLTPHLSPPPDAVVLGCTHFPFAARAISRVTGGVPLFDGAAGTARHLAKVLDEAGLINTKTGRGEVTLTSSDPTALPLYRRLFEKGE